MTNPGAKGKDLLNEFRYKQDENFRRIQSQWQQSFLTNQEANYADASEWEQDENFRQIGTNLVSSGTNFPERSKCKWTELLQRMQMKRGKIFSTNQDPNGRKVSTNIFSIGTLFSMNPVSNKIGFSITHCVNEWMRKWDKFSRGITIVGHNF